MADNPILTGIPDNPILTGGNAPISTPASPIAPSSEQIDINNPDSVVKAISSGSIPNQPLTFIDDTGIPQVVPATSAKAALDAGWKYIPPDKAQHIVDMKEAGEHPEEAGALSFVGNLIPGGRNAISNLGGPNLERQGLLAEANPISSGIGGLAGGITQAVGIGAVTGGAGEAGEIPSIGKLLLNPETAAIFGAGSITSGMNEDDVQNIPYNAESLVAHAGVDTLLGLAGESALKYVWNGPGASAVKAIKSGLSDLGQNIIDLTGTLSAKVTGNPLVEEQFGKAVEEGVQAGLRGEPIGGNQALKEANATELRKQAMTTAGTMNNIRQGIYDVAEQHYQDAMPVIIHNLLGNAPQTLANDVPALRATVTNVIDKLGTTLEQARKANYGWNGPLDTLEEGINNLKSSISTQISKGVSTPQERIYLGLQQFTRDMDGSLKYGTTLIDPNQKELAAIMRESVINPVKDMLGRFEENGNITPLAVRMWGPELAEHNANANKAYSEFKTADDYLMNRMGVKIANEGGRPAKDIADNSVLRLFKGEGPEGVEVPTSLAQQPTIEAINNWQDKVKNYSDFASKDLQEAERISELPTNVTNMLTKLQDQRDAAAHTLLGPRPEMQKLADLTANSRGGAGGLRAAAKNAGTAGLDVLAGIHPGIGLPMALTAHAHTALKYPVETAAMLAKAITFSAKTRGIVSSSVKKFLKPAETAIKGTVSHELNKRTNGKK